jgi:hypothetical protein
MSQRTYSTLLAKHNIRTIHIAARKKIHMLRSAKDGMGLKVPGIYCIPCDCNKVYFEWTGKTFETRCKEHMRHIHVSHQTKSVVMEHNIKTGHN